MSKLTLDLSALEVQSFVTDDAAGRLFGTVHARHKGHTGLQDTDCSAVDACPSAMIECTEQGCETKKDCPSNNPCSDFAPCDTKQGCPSNDPCSDLVECSKIGCSEFRCPTSHECTRGYGCDPSKKEPCISEIECTQICPEKA